MLVLTAVTCTSFVAARGVIIGASLGEGEERVVCLVAPVVGARCSVIVLLVLVVTTCLMLML